MLGVAAVFFLFFFLYDVFVLLPNGGQTNIQKKKKKSQRCAVYLVPSAKYGYTFEAPLKCKETQAACSLRRLNRASFFFVRARSVFNAV